MSIHHKISTTRRYTRARKSDDKIGLCPFCKPEERARAIYETSTQMVIPNRTTYDFFEGYPVEDHMMVIPKIHRESMSEFTDKEIKEHMEIVAEYEAKGYHFFGRGKGAKSRSVIHQHTHLIKIGRKPARFIMYLTHLDLLFAK